MKEIRATKKDLLWYRQKTPLEDIELDHLCFAICQLQSADYVTITIGDETRILKDRFHAHSA